MRTYLRSEIEAARKAWDLGEFADEWKPWRRLASEGGLIYPPDGTRYDSWEDDSPSQRAILIRAIRETPALLRRSIVGARSWGDVVARLVRGRDEIREDAALRDRDTEWRRRDELGPHEAILSLGAILGRIRDSLP
jgi:hypothetical protein